MTIHKELQVDLIQPSFNGSLGQFRVNCHMNEYDNTLPKLIKILVITKETLKCLKGYVLTVKNLVLGESLLEQRSIEE